MKKIILILFIGLTYFLSSCKWDLDIVKPLGSLDPNIGFVCGDSVWVDIRDDQIYQTIEIGTQCWFSKNLNIGEVKYLGQIQTHKDGKFEKYCYNNDPEFCNSFGGLYSRPDSFLSGICPEGWHVATDTDWKHLERLFGMPEHELDSINHSFYRGEAKGVGDKMKRKDDCSDTNMSYCGISNFEALLGGIADSTFKYGGFYGEYWTATKNSNGRFFKRAFHKNESGVLRADGDKSEGHSIRCLKDS